MTDAAPRPVIDRKKRLLFFLVIAVLGFTFLEAATRLFAHLRVFTTGRTNPYIDFYDPVPLFELQDLAGTPTWVRTKYQTFVPLNQHFSGVKSANTMRIFLLGSSAAAGWPHPEKLNGFTIAASLATKLRRLYPEKIIEVLNVAGGTYGTHRVKFVFDEIINYQPDLVLIYNGNNEFVETFVFQPRSLPEPLVRSALLRTLYDGIGKLAPQPKPKVGVKNYSEADTVSNRVSLLFGQASKYREDPQQFQQLLDRHRYNLTAMVAESKRREVPVMLMNVPVNLKDWIPNVSVHRRDLSNEDKGRWQQQFREGVLALERNDWEHAEPALRASCVIDDEYAEGHYNLGKALQNLDRLAEAKQEYITALERDAYPFRELPAFDRQLHQIAESEGVPIIDSISMLEKLAGDGILGLDVLLDYVHLTAASQEAVAHGILLAMDQHGLLPQPLAVPIADTRMSRPQASDDLGADESVVSMYRQLLVMRQYDKIDPVHEHFVHVLNTILLTDASREDWAREYLQIADVIQQVIVPYRRLLRAEKLGILSSEFSDDEARLVFANYVRLVQRLEGAGMSGSEFIQAIPEFEYPKNAAPRSSPAPG